MTQHGLMMCTSKFVAVEPGAMGHGVGLDIRFNPFVPGRLMPCQVAGRPSVSRIDNQSPVAWSWR